MKRRRIREWLGSQDTPSRSVLDSNLGWEYLLNALRTNSPGPWTSNLWELSKHFTSSVFVGINSLATQAASCEWNVYEKNPYEIEGDFKLPFDHPLHELFTDPNPDDSFGDVIYQLVQQLSLCGIALLWVPRYNEYETPQEMYVLPSASAVPQPPSPLYPHGAWMVNPFIYYGAMAYVPSYQNSAGAMIPAESVIRLKNAHPHLRYAGYSVLYAMSKQIDVLDNIDQARLTTMQKGATPTMAVEFDKAEINPNPEDVERIRTLLHNVNAGPLGEKIWLAPPGTKMTPVNLDVRNLQWESGWDQLTRMTLAALGTPATVAGTHEVTNNQNLYASMNQFYTMTLNPLLRRIAERFNKFLIRPHYGRNLYLHMEGQGVEDKELLERQLALDSRVGGITRNELRRLRRRPPIEGPLGEELIGVQSRIVYQGKGEGPTPAPIPVKAYTPERLAGLLEHAKSRGLAFETNGHSLC